MEVKLVKPWRFYEDGCRPVNYKAGLVQMNESVVKVAEQCGVLETKAETKQSKKKSETKE